MERRRAVGIALIFLAPLIAAPLSVMLFVADWRGVLGRALLAALVYGYAIGIPSGFALPVVVRRVGRRGWRLALAVGAAMLVLTAAGCLAAGVVLVAMGWFPAGQFWPTYAYTFRVAGIISLLIAVLLAVYESLTSELQAARERLQAQEIERERERKLALEARLASLESRIHPHFLFNTLNSISALIPADAERAEEMVGRLAALLRGSLDAAAQPVIPLAAELSLVQSYLEIEKARFGERLRYRIDASPEADEWPVPPLSVQSLVENAVKHGLSRQAGGGEIEVAARRDTDRLRIEVRDSGPGFDLASVQPGHGIDNLVSRLEALYGAEARLEVARRGGRSVAALVVPARRKEETQ